MLLADTEYRLRLSGDRLDGERGVDDDERVGRARQSLVVGLEQQPGRTLRAHARVKAVGGRVTAAVGAEAGGFELQRLDHPQHGASPGSRGRHKASDRRSNARWE